ncbi:hypothetical protein [Aldersonia kunmingensis]|uniref:hypothetical protein n=1 Tax=Aldersonia kunmingensis TaxID=408066 RepID=UPI000A629FB4|nr:hypothetical protein [Aldersonia kunmingensis]
MTATVAAVIVADVATACASSDTADEPAAADPLIDAAARAYADSAAAVAAIALAPQRGPALQTIADERTAHAAALNDEIIRAAGNYEDGTAPTVDGLPAPVPPPVPPPTVDELRNRLLRSQREAADLARTQSDYRAGLLGSISAACATHAGIVLA